MERLLLLLAVLPATAAPGLSVTSHIITGIEGGSVSVQCHYDRYLNTNVKYWCSGKVWSSCKIIQRSTVKQRDEDKISISDDRTRGVFTVTVRRLEKKDAGWYWCGIERAGTDEGIQLNLSIDEAARSTTITHQATTEQTSTSDPTSTETRHPESTSPPAGTSENNQGSQHLLRALIVTCGILLLLLLIPIVIYTRKINKKRSPSGEQEGDVLYTTVSFQKGRAPQGGDRLPCDSEDGVTYASLTLHDRSPHQGDPATLIHNSL
ncbi:CMRF35-like molecule 3 [Huso huso]|uniref:CMRF35-like molecule 3 n=1 Tax=Huso huso TaxID=61971 RepID=A0ABR1A030_HUSHU